MNKKSVEQLKKKRLSNSMRFLLVIIILYIGLAFWDLALIKGAVWKTGKVFVQILPILVLVFGVIYVINRYLDPQKIERHLGEESGLRGWLYAVIAGILIAGPPYVLYPIFGDLQKGGMKNSLIAVVLYNRNVKIQFLPAMIYYFGLPFSVVLSFYMLLFSLFNGMLVGVLGKRKKVTV